MNEKRFGENPRVLGDDRRRYLIQHISTAPKGWLGLNTNAHRVPKHAYPEISAQTAPSADFFGFGSLSNSAESAETCAEMVESSAPSTYRSAKVSAEPCYQTVKIKISNA